MTDQERQAIMTLAIMAAFADDRNDAAERDEVKRVADSLSRDSEINVAALYQDVLLKRATLDSAVSALGSPETRRLAYELSVGVCNADGALSDGERTFLYALETRLGFDHAEAASARAFTAQSEALAEAPVATEPPPLPATQADGTSTEEQDRMILNYAILNGALELLPESLATMAIIPLQMKLVFEVGKAHGYELDRGHVKDFLATAGVGLTSQYLEQIGVKLVGRLLGAVGGGLLGGLGRQATSSAFSFGTTWALGQVARRYYAGGRTLSSAALQETFSSLLGEAKTLQQRYAGEITAKARTIDVKQILSEIGAGAA